MDQQQNTNLENSLEIGPTETPTDEQLEAEQKRKENDQLIAESQIIQEQHLRSSCPPSKTDALIFKILVIVMIVISALDLTGFNNPASVINKKAKGKNGKPS
jgi:hypothetical protein